MTRHLLWLLLLVGCASCIVAVTHAQDILVLDDKNDNDSQTKNEIQLPPGNEPEERPGDESYTVFYRQWAEFRKVSEGGDPERADSILKGLLTLKEKNQVPAVKELAVSLVAQGNRELDSQKPDQAASLFRYAALMDPALPDAQYGLARTALAGGVTGFPRAVLYSVRGFLAPLQTPEGKVHFCSKVVVAALASLLALGFVFGVILLIKYNRLLRHDAAEMFGGTYDSSILDLLLWIILFFPVFIFMGPLWLAPLWIMFLWGYARGKEKVLGILVLIVFALCYPVYEGVARYVAISGQASVTPFINAFSSGSSPSVLRDFQAFVHEHPKDRDASILLSYLYKTDHKLDQATEVLQKHVLDDPSDSRAYNNLAAIYFEQGQTDLAIRLCERAVDLDGRNALYKFNLSSLNRAKFNFTDAQRLLDEARQSDPSLISKLEGGPQLVDSVPSEAIVSSRMAERSKSTISLLANPFTVFGGALLALTLIFHLRGTKTQGRATACSKCGKPFCKKCQPTATKSYGFCTQCLHMFVKKDGVSPASRKEKMLQIERYSHRQKLFLRATSLVLPGFEKLYHERVIGGLLLLFLWLGSLMFLLVNWRYSGISYLEASDNYRIISLPFFLVLGIVYIVCNVQTLRKLKS